MRLEFPKFLVWQGCYLGNMQGAAAGGHPMQATPCGLSKQGNAADCPENSPAKPKILEIQV